MWMVPATGYGLSPCKKKNGIVRLLPTVNKARVESAAKCHITQCIMAQVSPFYGKECLLVKSDPLLI